MSEDEITSTQIEMIPKTHLTNRLAEKERKHQRELEQKQREIDELRSQANPAPIAAQAANNVVNPPTESGEQDMMPQNPQQPMQQPQQQQPQGFVPAEVVQDVVRQALTEQDKQRQAAEQQARQQQLDQKIAQQQALLQKGREEVFKSVHSATENDPEFAKLLETHGHKVPDNVSSLLIGHDDPAAILKKLMSDEGHMGNYANADIVEQTRIMNKLSNLVMAEKLGNITPTPAGKFISKAETTGGRDPDNMTTSEYRKYLRSKGEY